jgi:y4mF family transcriptional regulator
VQSFWRRRLGCPGWLFGEGILLHALRKVCYSMYLKKDAIAYMTQIALRTPVDIGALIRDRRRELGLDQAELAERIGVGRLWVNQVERGKPGASLGLVLRALRALGLTLVTDEEGVKYELNEGNAVTNEIRRRFE